MSKRFYITTAIDYVNGQPHLGHAYEKVIADVIARAHRSFGQSTFFLTGLDEHGQKVQQAAAAEGKTPQAYCDELAAVWRGLTMKLDLTNDDFVRTTQARHKRIVQSALQRLYEQGDIYKGPYEGFYSTKEETFLTDKDRRPDGTFDPIWGEVIRLKEDNYYFKLGKEQHWLIQHIEQHPEFIAPDYRRNEVLGFLRNDALEDLCISRPVARLNWGIPLPFDANYVNYVWFDALSNYITVPADQGDPGALPWLKEAPTGSNPPLELWPADIHLVGKDIVKFHSVYWPIMLKAMGAPLPRQVLVHGWWQKDGQKMSKSTGNVVDPGAVIDEWGADAFRFYVVRELDIGPDGNWTDAGFRARYTAELANGLGNLVNRSLSMLKRYRNGQVPRASNELAGEAEKTVATTRALLEKRQLQAALQSIWSLVACANKYVEDTAPFKLAKDPSKAQRLDEVLYNLVEVCRQLAVMLWPFIPGTATKINGQLGLPGAPDKYESAKWGGLAPGHSIGTPAPLFPRKNEVA